LIGRNTAPIWLVANTNSRKAALFFISTATTSAGPIPREASHPATLRMRASKLA
jgi:hypothetical protein